MSACSDTREGKRRVGGLSRSRFCLAVCVLLAIGSGGRNLVWSRPRLSMRRKSRSNQANAEATPERFDRRFCEKRVFVDSVLTASETKLCRRRMGIAGYINSDARDRAASPAHLATDAIEGGATHHKPLDSRPSTPTARSNDLTSLVDTRADGHEERHAALPRLHADARCLGCSKTLFCCCWCVG